MKGRGEQALLGRRLAAKNPRSYTHEKLPEALITAAGSTVFAESNARLYVCTGHDAAQTFTHDNQAVR